MAQDRTDPNAELYQRLRMGKQVQEWVSSDPVGKDLFAHALAYAEEGWREFVALDPGDPQFATKAKSLHAKAQAPEQLMRYIQDRITQAENAQIELQYQQEADRENRYDD